MSGTARAIDTAGRDDEYNYQRTLKGMELKRDMETTLLSIQPMNAGAVATARNLGGIACWIGTNDVFNDSDGGSPSPIDGTDARTEGTQRAFTEAELKESLQAIWKRTCAEPA